MGNNLSRVDIYNQNYVALNHAYVEMYQFYNKLLESVDADEEVLGVMREILLVFNPTLDRIKSEMTIKTRYKEESQNISNATDSASVVLHGNFTGD